MPTKVFAYEHFLLINGQQPGSLANNPN